MIIFKQDGQAQIKIDTKTGKKELVVKYRSKKIGNNMTKMMNQYNKMPLQNKKEINKIRSIEKR